MLIFIYTFYLKINSLLSLSNKGIKNNKIYAKETMVFLGKNGFWYPNDLHPDYNSANRKSLYYNIIRFYYIKICI